MKYYYIIGLVTLSFVNKLCCQTPIFSGKLRFSFEAGMGKVYYKFLDSTDNNKMDELRSFKFHEILINDCKYLNKNVDDNGIISGIHYQNSDTAYLYPSKITFEQIPKKSKLTFREKTKESKFILGLLCKKYIYDLQDGTKIIAWIPENLNYMKQYFYGKFFENFFFPHGLAFEKEMHFKFEDKEKVNKWKLVNIELFDVTDKDFDDFIKNYDK